MSKSITRVGHDWGEKQSKKERGEEVGLHTATPHPIESRRQEDQMSDQIVPGLIRTNDVS